MKIKNKVKKDKEIKEIRFWWFSNLSEDYEVGNEDKVDFEGRGELNEEMWKEIKKKVGLLKSFKLESFGEDLKGKGWKMLSSDDWYLLVVDEGYNVRECIKEYGDRMLGEVG